MRHFLTRLLQFSLAGFFPVLLPLIFGYCYYDPFKVLRSYDDFSNPYIIPNRDYISTEMFLRNNKKHHYNSFILGSSRTIAYKPASWKQYLNKGARTFMFDASAESVFGIYTKLKFLDTLNTPIDNALIIFCRDNIFRNTDNRIGHLFIKHPAVSGENRLHFQKIFFETYLDPDFLYAFYDFTFTGVYKPYMSDYIENKKLTFDTITNEMNSPYREKEITLHPDEYYEKRKWQFYERKGERTDSIQEMDPKSLFMFKEIKRILEKHQTHYKIILSPLYEQVKFHPSDLAALRAIYGNHLYDFSGKNTFTENITNYYEASHYRPFIGDSIFRIIYKDDF